MDMNKFARDNDLARKFEKAIEILDRGKGWEVFAGLDKGPVVVLVVYDGLVRFVPFKKATRPKPKKKAKPKKVKPGEVVKSYSGDIDGTLIYEVKVDPEPEEPPKTDPEE